MNKAILFVLTSLSIACNASDAQKNQMRNAIIGNDQATVLQLLNDGFDINTPLLVEDNTALHRAAIDGHDQLVELLIMRGAIVDKRNINNHTPLMFSRNAKTTEILLRHEADINAQNKYGNTPLMYATQRGDIDSVTLLLKHGAKINSVTQIYDIDYGVRGREQSALDYASDEHYEDIKNLLIKAGAKTGEQLRKEQKEGK